MRKISELLEIAKPFHISYGGQHKGMCFAAEESLAAKLMSLEEKKKLVFYASGIVSKIDDESAYLISALTSTRDELVTWETVKDWWEDHINNFKEEGL